MPTNLPITIAKKLLLLKEGGTIPSTQLKHSVVDRMYEDGILMKKRAGANRHVYSLPKAAELDAYLLNSFGVANLERFIAGYANEILTRAEAIENFF